MRREIGCTALLLVAVLTGCGSKTEVTSTVGPTATVTADPAVTTPDGSAGTFSLPPSTTTRGTPPPPAASTASVPYTLQEFYSDYHTAVRVVNQYWTTHWGEHFTGTYHAPAMWTGGRFPDGIYEGGVDQILCDTSYLKSDNAYYCIPGKYVAFDVNFLWKARYNGDMFVYMIVAHEWGHAIQDQLRSELKLVASELQADCFAGAALQGAAKDGTLLIEPGDLNEVSAGLTDIADSSPWGKASDHGAPEERITYFNYGVQQGATGCLPRR